MDNKTIGRFIHQLRIEKGFTQQELADQLNVTNKAISKWECGRGCPDISLFEKLSDVLGVSVIELLNGRHFEAPPPQQEILKTSIDYSDKIVKENSQHLNTRMVILGLVILFGFGFFLLPFLNQTVFHFPEMTPPIYTPLYTDPQEPTDLFSSSYFHSLERFHTAYIGDNSKVGNLISALPLNQYGYSIEILSEDYQLNVYYHDVSWNIDTINGDEHYVYKSILYNSLAAFSYIDNMNCIQFYFSDQSMKINRDDFNQLFTSENMEGRLNELLVMLDDEKIVEEKIQFFNIL